MLTSFKQGNEALGCIKAGEFVQLSNYQLLVMEPAELCNDNQSSEYGSRDMSQSALQLQYMKEEKYVQFQYIFIELVATLLTHGHAVVEGQISM